MLLALAIIAYNEKGPGEALMYLKRMAENNPLGCPAEIWLGIGICYFKMRNLAKAKFALEHSLSKQPNNAMALTSLAITEMQINFSCPKQRFKAISLLQQSFEIDDTNPLTMKHLAEHFFFSGDLDLSESLCKRALKFCERLERPDTSDLPTFRREIYLLRSDLAFIMGKILHQREDYEGAM